MSRPLAGEELCGDGVGIFGDDSQRLFAVADGLGHGPEAHHATATAMAVVAAGWQSELEALLWACHEATRGTRGLALFLCRVRQTELVRLECSGVGNVECKTLDLGRFSPFSRDGIIGRNLRKTHLFRGAGQPGALLAIHSDGISSRFQLESYRHLPLDQASDEIVAAFGKAHDDATLLLLRL